MAGEVMTIPQATFGLLIAVASSAFSGAGIYFGLVYRIKRLEECHAELREDFESFKRDEFKPFRAEREVLTLQWREDRAARDVRDARAEAKLERLEEIMVGIADKLKVPL